MATSTFKNSLYADVSRRAVERQPLAWMTWRAVLLLTAAVFVVRLVYLLGVRGFELFGDEAFYWEWSRHPDWCYYEKGPGIAWLVAASTRLFGAAEWSVRLPMAAVSALATLALAKLATAVSRGDTRVGFFAAAAFTLAPAYQANAQICTQDGPLIACWIAGAWAAWRLFDGLEQRRAGLLDWALLGAALGLGCLFKQAMLLLMPGLVLFALLRRRRLGLNRSSLAGASLALAIVLLLLSPMFIWNQQHGWPTLAHTLGHLGAPGGDQASLRKAAPFPGVWAVGLWVAQLGAFGPPLMLLIILAVIWAIRNRRTDEHWSAHLLMLACAAPALVLYTFVSLYKKAEANWPMHAFATLLVLVAQFAVLEIPRRRRLVAEWLADPRRPRPHRGLIRRRPETVFQVAWDWVGIYGVGGWLVLSLAPVVLVAARSPAAERFSGHHARAASANALLAQVQARTGREPLLIASHYMDAALLTFYLPGHPTVYDAGRLLGGRGTSYDFWPDTDLADPSLHGRPAILLGSNAQCWSRALQFAGIEELDGPCRACLGREYAGPASH